MAWRDAHFDLDIEPRRDYIVHTVGWEIRRGSTFLVLASEDLPGRGWRAYTSIPIVTIVGELDLSEAVATMRP